MPEVIQGLFLPVCEEVKGLVPASNQNGSDQIGFIVFIRGLDASYSCDDDNNEDVDVDVSPIMSKDAKIAKIYQEQVYYPLIEDIRIITI